MPTPENQPGDLTNQSGQIVPQAKWKDFCEWAEDGGYDQSYFNRFDSKSVALQETYLEERGEQDAMFAAMLPASPVVKHVEPPRPKDENFYYLSGKMGMKSNGSFTAEMRHWMPFTRSEAEQMTADRVKPWGATRVGVFVGTVHGERVAQPKDVAPQPERTEYPFGKADRDDQFHGSRVRVLPELKGDVAWTGTVQCAINGGRLFSVIRHGSNGSNLSVRISGSRIIVIERIENGAKMGAQTNIDDSWPVEFISSSGAGRADYRAYNRNSQRGAPSWLRVDGDGKDGFREPIADATPQEKANAVASVKRHIKDMAIEAITEFTRQGWTITPDIYRQAGVDDPNIDASSNEPTSGMA